MTVVKGFLYQTHEGKWLLAEEPDLKSCCVGASHKQGSQVYLEGDFSGYPKTQVMKMEGTLLVEEGASHLANAHVIEGHAFPYLTVAVLGTCIIFLLWKTRIWKLSWRR